MCVFHAVTRFEIVRAINAKVEGVRGDHEASSCKIGVPRAGLACTRRGCTVPLLCMKTLGSGTGELLDSSIPYQIRVGVHVNLRSNNDLHRCPRVCFEIRAEVASLTLSSLPETMCCGFADLVSGTDI